MIRKIARLTLLICFSLITHNYVWANLNFTHQAPTIIKTALILALFESLLKPIIKLLLLPINILTLGTIRLVINTVGLYLAVFLVTEFSVFNLVIPKTIWPGLSQPLQLNGFFAYLATALSLNLITRLFSLVLYKKRPI